MPLNADSLHIVMLTNVVAPDKLGGLERYVRELADRLALKGAQVTVISKRVKPGDEVRELSPSGVRIIRYDGPSKKNPLFAIAYPLVTARGVNRAIREAQNENEAGRKPVIHCHFPVPALVPAVLRRTYVYTCHAPVYKEILPERQGSYALPGRVQSLAVRALRFAERMVLRRARQVVTLSAFVKGEVSDLDPSVGARVQLIPGGLDTTWFSPAETAVSRDGKGPVLFTARRLVDRTGVENLVKAMPSIIRRIPDLQLYVAGSGPRESAIRDLIDANELHNCVTLLGRVSDESLRDWYRSADLAVTPTKDLEGFGLSTAEALSCGTPALVTPVGANPEVVDGLSPLMVASGADPEGIANAVVELCSSSELAAIRRNARSHVHPRYSWEAVVDRHLEVYEQVATTDRVPG